jgi:serine protease AprX
MRNERKLPSVPGLLVLVALIAMAISGSSQTRHARPADQEATASSGKIAPWVMDRLASGGQAEFLIVLADQADLSGAEALPTKLEKGRYVRDALWSKAQSTQAPLLAQLAARHIEHRSYYIVNLIWARGDRNLALDLAARPDVARIEANPHISNFKAPFSLSSPLSALYSPNGVEPNIAYVHAPDVWALGFTGQGIVVGGQDTGYDWTHPALKPHYRGWDGVSATHDYNWHDSIHSGGGSCGANSAQPCDDYGHGTHTMGTAVGDDGAGNQIGMAPGAKWIGCRNMNQGVGTPATYLECFEFFLAPYPVNGTVILGDPALAPDVTVNSWSCPISEGCSWDTLQAAVEAQRTAGIMTVVAATNNGYTCSSIREPPAVYAAAYTVGALNTGTDSIASFSNLGPVTVDGSNRRKPDIAAPGTSIRSSVPGGGYSSAFSGTSMATPHVAGAVALLWSARPAFRNQITLTEQVLNDSAVHISSTECSSSGWPNNTYGYGRLDLRAAVGIGTLMGVISDAVISAPITGASVQATLNATQTFSTTSTAGGLYSLGVISGVYTVTASAFGFQPATIGGVPIVSGLTTTQDMALFSFKVYLPLWLENWSGP